MAMNMRDINPKNDALRHKNPVHIKKPYKIATILAIFLICLFTAILLTGGFAILSIHGMITELENLENEDLRLIDLIGQMQRQAESIVSLTPAINRASNQGERETARQRVDDRLAALLISYTELPNKLLDVDLLQKFTDIGGSLRTTLLNLDKNVARRLELEEHIRGRYRGLMEMANMGSDAFLSEDIGLSQHNSLIIDRAIVLELAAGIATHSRQVAVLKEKSRTLEASLKETLTTQQGPWPLRVRILLNHKDQIFDFKSELLRVDQKIENLLSRSSALSSSNVGLTGELARRVAEDLADNRRQLRGLFNQLLIAAIATLTISILTLVISQRFISKRLIGPLRYFRKRMHSWVHKRQSIDPFLGKDEIADLSRSLADLTETVTIRERELKRHRDALELLNQQKNTFFSIIAHDLRSPFSAYVGVIELLKMELNEDMPDKDSIREYADMIDDTTQRLLDLVENLLDWARLQMNNVAPQFTEIDLEPLSKKVVDLFQSMAQQKSVTLEIHMPAQTYIWADPGMVQMALRNLIANAVKFSQPHQMITISAHMSHNMVCITVQDQGVGIPQDKIEKLFQIETKTSTAGTAGEIGSGLGLPLVKALMERMGGHITIESSLGKGTTVSLCLQEAKKPSRAKLVKVASL